MDNLKEINCKEIFKKAYENRYTWKNAFHGYQGKCIFLTNNNLHKGDFVLGKDFKPNIQKIEDEKVVKNIASQLFEVCIHRVKREFESVHSENKFNFLLRDILKILFPQSKIMQHLLLIFESSQYIEHDRLLRLHLLHQAN